MNQLVRVLTAVDFSDPGRTAFDQALALSRESNAELTVVHAVPKEHRFRWGARERITMIAAQREAADAAGVRYQVSVQHGDPAGSPALPPFPAANLEFHKLAFPNLVLEKNRFPRLQIFCQYSSAQAQRRDAGDGA